MKLIRSSFLALALLSALPSYSQVQIFEQEVSSGIHPYVGFKWSKDIMQVMGGFEYNIEGRTTLGVSYSKPLEDTLFDSNLKSYLINPYGIFEFIEPGIQNPFSFAMRISFSFEDVLKDDEENFNNFTRSILGGGPIFGFRFYGSENLAIIPTFAYEFSYVRFRRDLVPKDPAVGEVDFDEDFLLWHDLPVGCNFLFIIDELNGINFGPKLVAKLGNGRDLGSDLINLDLTLGYVRKF